MLLFLFLYLLLPSSPSVVEPGVVQSGTFDGATEGWASAVRLLDWKKKPSIDKYSCAAVAAGVLV